MLGELLNIQPNELKFSFEVRKQVSASLRLINITSEYVAFKIKTTSPKKYCVRPNTGVVPPQSSAEIVVTMQAQKEVPPDMQCKDKFLIQSVLQPGGGNAKDVGQDMFNKESGREINEVKLRVVYVPPPEPPSPVAESSEEGVISPSPFPPSSSAAKSFAPVDPNQKDVTELKAKLMEARSNLAIVTEDVNSTKREIQRLKEKATVGGMDGRFSAGEAGLVEGFEERSTETKKPISVRASQGWSTIIVALVAILFFFIGFFYGKAPTPAGFTDGGAGSS